MTKLEQQLSEELQRWQLVQIPLRGVPTGFPTPGIHVEILETDVRSTAIVKLLVEKGICTQEEGDEMYQRCMLERLTAIREGYEAAKSAEVLVAKQRLLGPDGKPMNNGD
jgi:hypothetical protein